MDAASVLQRNDTRTARFHFWMAALFLLIAFGGFTPTYWVPVATARFHQPPIVHIHGVLLFAWTLLYFAQTWLIAAGRLARHRGWGMAGIALFTAMVCSILVTKITNLHLAEAAGMGDAERRFSAVALCSLVPMVALFTAAIRNVGRPEVHKRWMYLLMCFLMVPALARVFLVALAPPGAAAGGPPPVAVIIPPTLVAALLAAVGALYDWRTRGRVHPVYAWGAPAVVLWTLAIVPFSSTSTWMRIARAIEALAG